MTRRFRWILLLAAFLLVASAIAGVAQPRLGRAARADTTQPPAKKTITVTGNGSVTTVPDRTSFSFTVQTRAATAKAALAQNATDASALVTALKNAGVAAADLQTGQVSLDPQTNDDGTQVLGYVASNTVSATTALARAGALVDAAVGAGATDVSGPTLARSDADALYRDALKDAVADAHDKAQALAAAAGVTLGAVDTVVEDSQAMPMPIAMKAGAGSAGTPIEPGTQEIDATVSVTYEAA